MIPPASHLQLHNMLMRGVLSLLPFQGAIMHHGPDTCSVIYAADQSCSLQSMPCVNEGKSISHLWLPHLPHIRPVLCCSVLCCAVLCCAALCCALLRCILQASTVRGVRVSVACMSRAGREPGYHKTNQDNCFAFEKYITEDQALFGAMDGHGPNGER